MIPVLSLPSNTLCRTRSDYNFFESIQNQLSKPFFPKNTSGRLVSPPSPRTSTSHKRTPQPRYNHSMDGPRGRTRVGRGKLGRDGRKHPGVMVTEKKKRRRKMEVTSRKQDSFKRRSRLSNIDESAMLSVDDKTTINLTSTVEVTRRQPLLRQSTPVRSSQSNPCFEILSPPSYKHDMEVVGYDHVQQNLSQKQQTHQQQQPQSTTKMKEAKTIQQTKQQHQLLQQRSSSSEKKHRQDSNISETSYCLECLEESSCFKDNNNNNNNDYNKYNSNNKNKTTNTKSITNNHENITNHNKCNLNVVKSNINSNKDNARSNVANVLESRDKGDSGINNKRDKRTITDSKNVIELSGSVGKLLNKTEKKRNDDESCNYNKGMLNTSNNPNNNYNNTSNNNNSNNNYPSSYASKVNIERMKFFEDMNSNIYKDRKTKPSKHFLPTYKSLSFSNDENDKFLCDIHRGKKNNNPYNNDIDNNNNMNSFYNNNNDNSSNYNNNKYYSNINEDNNNNERDFLITRRDLTRMTSDSSNFSHPSLTSVEAVRGSDESNNNNNIDNYNSNYNTNYNPNYNTSNSNYNYSNNYGNNYNDNTINNNINKQTFTKQHSQPSDSGTTTKARVHLKHFTSSSLPTPKNLPPQPCHQFTYPSLYATENNMLKVDVDLDDTQHISTSVVPCEERNDLSKLRLKLLKDKTEHKKHAKNRKERNKKLEKRIIAKKMSLKKVGSKRGRSKCANVAQTDLSCELSREKPVKLNMDAGFVSDSSQSTKFYEESDTSEDNSEQQPEQQLLQMANSLVSSEGFEHNCRLFGCERLRINVCGQLFETRRAVLERHPDTLLGNCSKRQAYFDEERRELFFDRHRPSFEAIFNFYQHGGRLRKPYHVPSDVFLEELEFFEMEEETLEEYKRSEGYIEEETPMPEKGWMRAMWTLFEDPQSSKAAFLMAVLSVCMTILSIVIFCVETLPYFAKTHCISDEMPNFLDPFFIIETTCTLWFTIEAIARFISCPDKLEFWKDFKNIVDVTAVLPYYWTLFNVLWTMSCAGAKTSASLSFLRVIRLIRVFKLTKHSVGLQVLLLTFRASLEGLGLFLVALMVSLLVFSSAVYYAEIGVPESHMKSIPEAFWWAIITMTTVGYGDMVPMGIAGRLIGAACAITGVLTLAIPVPIITGHFNRFYSHKTGRARHL